MNVLLKKQNPNYYIKNLWSVGIEGYSLIATITALLSFEYFAHV